MSNAAEARTWAPGALRGIIDSLYTPLSGPGGERIDESAFRTLIGHCLDSLGHDGIWVGGLVGEAWAMSLSERKQILEIRNRPKIRFVPIPGRAHKTQTGCRNDAFKNLAVA